jgi:hypothetical protein
MFALGRRSLGRSGFTRRASLPGASPSAIESGLADSMPGSRFSPRQRGCFRASSQGRGRRLPGSVSSPATSANCTQAPRNAAPSTCSWSAHGESRSHSDATAPTRRAAIVRCWSRSCERGVCRGAGGSAHERCVESQFARALVGQLSRQRAECSLSERVRTAFVLPVQLHSSHVDHLEARVLLHRSGFRLVGHPSCPGPGPRGPRTCARRELNQEGFREWRSP